MKIHVSFVPRSRQRALLVLFGEPWTFSKESGDYGAFNALPSRIKEQVIKITAANSLARCAIVFQFEHTFFVFSERENGVWQGFWYMDEDAAELLEPVFMNRANEYLANPAPWWKVFLKNVMLTVVIPALCFGTIYAGGATLLWQHQPLLGVALVGIAVYSFFFPFYLEHKDRKLVQSWL